MELAYGCESRSLKQPKTESTKTEAEKTQTAITVTKKFDLKIKTTIAVMEGSWKSE
jgi:hypothetical protein